jgi:hypothetical protein
MTTQEEILSAVKTLPEEARLEIVDSILHSILPPDPNVDKAWAEVARKRMEEIDRGDVQTVPGAAVLLEAKQRILRK